MVVPKMLDWMIYALKVSLGDKVRVSVPQLHTLLITHLTPFWLKRDISKLDISLSYGYVLAMIVHGPARSLESRNASA